MARCADPRRGWQRPKHLQRHLLLCSSPLGKPLSFSESQFLHFSNIQNNTYFIEFSFFFLVLGEDEKGSHYLANVLTSVQPLTEPVTKAPPHQHHEGYDA